jgi:DNA-binding winged helix-turn-helix (wHTH) protein/TolB-like protein
MDKLAQAIPSLGRIELAWEPDFTIGALEVRPSSREVEAGGVRRVLQRRVMQVLVALAQSTSEVVPQRELIQRCWDGLSVSDDAIWRCIAQLRRLAETWSEPPFEIETIAGIGYRLEAAPGGGRGANTGTPSAIRIRGDPRARWAWVAAVLIVAAAATAGVWLARDRLAAPASVGVAVLPLETLSAGQDARYLADSISGEVRSVLGANQIAAVSRADTPSLRGADAARLGFAFVVGGSVLHDAGATRVSVRLEDARSRAAVWSADFVRPNGAVAGLDAEVATKLADIVEIAEYARTSKPPLSDDAALSALLEAHDAIRWDRRESWARLLDVAARPVAAAPRFAFGHSMLATANAYAVRWNAMPERTPQFAATARREAHRALELDPRDSGAYFALSILEPADHYRAREVILLQGLKQQGRPAAPFASLYASEGEVLRGVGRFQDSLPFFQRAQAIDPLSPIKNEGLILAYWEAGQETQAEELLAQSVSRWPDHPEMRTLRLSVTAFSGSPAAASALLDDPAARPAELAGPAIDAWRALLLARSARTPAHVAAAARLVVGVDDRGLLDHETAVMMLAGLGEVDAAFAAAQKAVREERLEPWVLFTEPTRAMRRDPRFARLAASLGLVDYWRSTGKWPDFCAGPKAEIDCRTVFGSA